MLILLLVMSGDDNDDVDDTASETITTMLEIIWDGCGVASRRVSWLAFVFFLYASFTHSLTHSDSINQWK